MTNEEQLAKWRETLERCRQDVLALFHHRQIWRAMRPALVGDDGGFFLRHYDNMYVSTQTAALRRLSDETKGTASFARLLGSIENKGKILTAELRASEHDDDAEYYRDRDAADFKDRWCKAGRDHIDKAGVQGDRARFVKLAEKAKKFFDNAVAHRHDGVFESDLTYKEIDDAIDNAIDNAGLLLRRYEEILNSSHLATLEPVIQGDWRKPFRQELFGPDDRAEPRTALDQAPTWREEER